MSAELATLFAAVGAVGAMLAVLVPLICAQGASLRREIDALRVDQTATRTELRADIGELRGGLHALTERMARIEGSLSGPWRLPANGSPAAPSAPPPPEATT